MHSAARDVVVVDEMGGWDPAIAIPTLVGSILSFLASSTVILCWIFFGDQRRTFRYALILNLTVAECANSLNNTISGIYVMAGDGYLKRGPLCDLNGWVGQFTVQAVDFSILAISVVTLLTIQLKSYIIYASTIKKAFICISIWIVPTITSTLALGYGLYAPVSGNWCWIAQDHNYMRYALTHGFRLAIIVITFFIYIFVFFYMHKRLKGRNTSHRTYSFDYGADPNGFEMNFRLQNSGVLSGCSTPNRASYGNYPAAPAPAYVGGGGYGNGNGNGNNNNNNNRALTPGLSPDANEKRPASSGPRGLQLDEKKELLVAPPRVRVRQTSAIDRDVWRMVLLNMYPVTYLILWLPGLVNRFAEATGHYSRAFGILQSTTQYIGLVNACVYGFREHRKDIKRWWNGGR